MNVIVDYGNSSAKVGIFDEHKLSQKHLFKKLNELEDFIKNFSGENIIISSVNTEATLIVSWTGHFQNTFVLTHTLPLPLKINYTTPHTLGVDRIAAVCGARHAFPDRNCLVIDAGTCITFDFVDAHGQYYGGSISPGLNMRFNAMHTFTARLPLVQPVDNPELIGNSTESCLQSGAIIGLCEEINGVISRYTEKFDDLQVILCGGDAPFFENKLKASIFVSPELVLSGLNSILIYNVNR